MADLGIQQAFARYGAKLHNVQWSVSAWVEYIQSGKDASKIKKSFDPKLDLIGELIELQGDMYVFQFRRAVMHS
jgi:hypothetical protein